MAEQGQVGAAGGRAEAADTDERRRRTRAVVRSVVLSVAVSLIATAIANAIKARAERRSGAPGSGITSPG